MRCAGEGDSKKGFLKPILSCDSKGNAGFEVQLHPLLVPWLCSAAACSRLLFDPGCGRGSLLLS